MLLPENGDGGGMADSDLRGLITQRIPEHRAILERSHTNLEEVAQYCEINFFKSPDKQRAFEETKKMAVQSLASVAYQINTLARDMLDMLELQSEKIGQLGSQMDGLNMVVSINKEKAARREIGMLTTNKMIQKQAKIIQPSQQEPITRYKRMPIDYTVLDELGHGVKPPEQPLSRNTMVSRAGSSVSAAVPSHYGHYGQYGTAAGSAERTANIGNTLSRGSMRSGLSGMMGGAEHYRVPQVMPVLDEARFSAQSGGAGDYVANSPHVAGSVVGSATPSSHSTTIGYTIGSDCGSSLGGPAGDRYGTLRAPRMSHNSAVPSPAGGAGDHGMSFPPPLAQLHTNYGDLPPPPAALMQDSLHEDLPLPPPPAAMQQSFFDAHPDWVPLDYIEKAVVLYDYDADKVDELSLRENCVVYVVRKNDDGWYEGVFDGITGLFPGNYVQAIQ